MIELQSNTEQILTNVALGLSAIDIDRMTRLQASTLMAQMRQRIHIDGKDSSGSKIGTYSLGYLKTRLKHNRSNDPNVILSLTRQMENSMTLYPITNGTGIGYATAENLQKARWCENTYKKKIFSPTAEERALVNEIGQNYIKEHLNK